MKRCLTILALLWFVTGCQPQTLRVNPPLAEQGEAFLYINPFPQEAGRLRFSLENVSAVREDGTEYPLSLFLPELHNDAVKRQRQFAAGVLPPGNYLGLSFKVKAATLLDEEGVPQNLLLPKTGVRVDSPFIITRKKATLLSLAFNFERSVREGFAFTLAFTITVPGKPVTGLVGYVSNYASNTLTVFDKQYKQVVGVIATGGGPRGIAIDQQRRRAYVALAGEDAVEVVDMAAGEIINRIKLKPADAPQEIALTPDGRLLISVNTGSNKVSFMDPLSFLELKRIDVGDTPSSILIDPAGVRAYVFNSLSTSISVIDIANMAVATVLPSEPGLSRGQFNRRGDVLYTIHELSAYLRLINPFSLAVLQRYQVGMGMTSLKVDTATDLIYAGKKYDRQIQVYEPSAFIPIASIRTDGGTLYMTIDGEENNLYVLGANATLQVVNLVSREVIAELDVGEEPFRVSLIGER